jgi:hypothetical protein
MIFKKLNCKLDSESEFHSFVMYDSNLQRRSKRFISKKRKKTQISKNKIYILSIYLSLSNYLSIYLSIFLFIYLLFILIILVVTSENKVY